MRGLRLLALAFAAAATVSHGAPAQTLYKWVDKDGKVQYSDKAPAGFKGEVTKIETDATADPVPRAPAAPVKARVEPEGKAKPNDVAGRRKQVREALALKVSAARAKLEAAQKALSEGEGAIEGENQFVRQNFHRDAARPSRTPPPRTNCMSQTSSDGKAIWNCPRQVPTEAYFDRRQKLEEAVRLAEEELTEAERAYRRGVD